MYKVLNECLQEKLIGYTFKIVFNKAEHCEFELVYLNHSSDSIKSLKESNTVY